MTRYLTLPYAIPYYAQIASPELAEAIFVDGLDPRLDPRWSESGAETPEEYAYWVERACGVACLKMCVEALGGPRRPLLDWAREGLRRGGYLVCEEAGGRRREVGWIHSTLAVMAGEYGLLAEALAASLEEIAAWLAEGWLLIASVSYEAGDERVPITHRGGHLMVVHGVELEDERPAAFFVHNPSGRRPEWQIKARIPRERFSLAYSGRVIRLRTGENPAFKTC